MPPIKKVVAGSRDRKREKRMNATTQAKTRNVYVRDIMMPVVFCKDCKYCEDESYTDEDTGKEVKYLVCDRWYEQDDADGNMFPKADDFCSRGERKDEID